MKVLIVLIVGFIITLCISYFFTGYWDFILSGNVAMMLMLWFASLGHFMLAKGMVLMLPAFIPFKKATIYKQGYWK